MLKKCFKIGNRLNFLGNQRVSFKNNIPLAILVETLIGFVEKVFAIASIALLFAGYNVLFIS